MADPRPWIVKNPRPLVERTASLWTVDDDVPGLPVAGRRMTIVRQRSGDLLFYNAVPLPEQMLAQVRALGTPKSLVLPNQYHALDGASFIAKLGVTAYAPAVGLEPLAKNGVAARPINELSMDEGHQVITVEGFATHEAVLLIDDTLVVADLLTNVPHQWSPAALMMRLMDFTGPAPRLPKPVRKRVLRNEASVKALLEQLAGKSLKRLIPSHGNVLEHGVDDALRNVARSLARG
jgi:hypothetical protein